MRPGGRVHPWLVIGVGGVVLALVVHSVVPPQETLAVDAGQVAATLQWDEVLRGRPLTEDERSEAVRELADEEILLAEARRRGHLRRGYVFGRLLKKMRFLLAEDLVVPSDAELRSVYDAAPERWRRPGAAAFDQVFFRAGSPNAPRDPGSFLATLQEEADPTSLGDPHPLGAVVGLQTEEELVRVLGEPAAVRLFAAPLRTWVGPVASPSGTHFVRVRTRTDPWQMPFDEVLPRLRGAWTLQRQRETIERRTAELVSRYRVEWEGSER